MERFTHGATMDCIGKVAGKIARAGKFAAGREPMEEDA